MLVSLVLLSLSVTLATGHPGSASLGARSLLSVDPNFDFSSCSASAGSCVRLGFFYCANATATASATIEAPSCLRIRGYNKLIDWYRSYVNMALGGLIARVPVQFVPLTLPPHSPSSLELAQLVNSTFWEGPNGAGRALIDFVVLPPGAAWWELAMLRFERERIPAITAHAPLASLYQCAQVPAFPISSTSVTDISGIARASVPASSFADALTPSCLGRSGARRFEYLHGLTSTADQFLLGWVSLLALRKVTSMAIVVASDVSADTHPLGLASVRGFRAKMLQPIRAGVQQAAKENHISILDISVVQLQVTPGYTAANASALAADRALISQKVSHLQALAPQAVAFITLDCSPWIQALREHDFAPRSVAATFCIREGDYVMDSDVASAWTKEDAQFSPAAALAVATGRSGADSLLVSSGASSFDTLYMSDSAQWSSQMNGNEYTEDAQFQEWALFPHANAHSNLSSTLAAEMRSRSSLSSPRQFEAIWKEVLGLDADSTAVPSAEEAAVLAAFSVLQGAITLANTNGSVLLGPADIGVSPVLVNRQLQLYYEHSFYGLLTTNRFGINQQKSIVSMQRSGRGDVSIVAPQSAAGMDFIFPMPTWSERVYVRNVLSRYAVGWVVLALILTCGVATLVLLAAFQLYRSSASNNRAHNALHVSFFFAVGFGALFGFTTPLVWSVDNNDAMCRARLWLWTMAPHMVLDLLVAASVCMDREVRRHGQNIMSISTKPSLSLSRRIALLAFVLFLPQLLVNCIWSAGFGGMRPTIVQTDPMRARDNYTACLSSSGGDVCMLLTVLYGGFVMAVGLVHAYRVRKWMRRHHSAGLFQDAQSVSLALALFAVTASVVVAVQAALAVRRANPGSQAVLYGLRSIGILIAFQGCFTLLILRRLLDGLARTNGSRRTQRAPPPNAVQQRNASDNHRVGLQSNALKSRVSALAHGPGNNASLLPPGSVHPITHLHQSDADGYPNVFSRGGLQSGDMHGVEMAPMMGGGAGAGGAMHGHGHLAVPGVNARVGSISVIAESPSGGAGDDSTSPRLGASAGWVAPPAFPITPMSPEDTTHRMHGSAASALLPSFCVLPDSTHTAALDSASFLAWRLQLSRHAFELEQFVALKEAEQNASQYAAHFGSSVPHNAQPYLQHAAAAPRMVSRPSDATQLENLPHHAGSAALSPASTHGPDSVLSPRHLLLATATSPSTHTTSRTVTAAPADETSSRRLTAQSPPSVLQALITRKHSRRSSSVGDEQTLLAASGAPMHHALAVAAASSRPASRPPSRPPSSGCSGSSSAVPAVVVVHTVPTALDGTQKQQETHDSDSKWKIS